MNGLFGIDGPFVKYGGKLWDLLWLNILTILCSIPIITFSDSLAAMHYVLLKIYRDEEDGITKTFFKSFWSNLKQGIIIQGVFMVVCYMLCICLWLIWQNGKGILTIPLIIFSVLIIAVWMWTLILQSRYTNSVPNTIRHALAACLAHPVRTILMLAGFFLPFFFLLFSYKMIPIVLFIGFSIPGIIQTFLYNDIFVFMETPQVEERIE